MSEGEKPISQVCAARQGVIGMVLCGLSKFTKRIIQFGTVKL